MPSYLVETYLARGEAINSADRDERARNAAAELTRGRMCVRFEFAIRAPEDETCFFVFEAPTAHHAALAAQRAGLDPIRVVEAVCSGKEEQ